MPLGFLQIEVTGKSQSLILTSYLPLESADSLLIGDIAPEVRKPIQLAQVRNSSCVRRGVSRMHVRLNGMTYLHLIIDLLCRHPWMGDAWCVDRIGSVATLTQARRQVARPVRRSAPRSNYKNARI